MAAIQAEEDAAALQFGEGFGDEELDGVLTNAEVAIVLERLRDEREEHDKPLTEVFEKTFLYAKRFSQMNHLKDTDTRSTKMVNLREDLENRDFTTEDEQGNTKNTQLQQFELASLVNLNPENYDEAVSLIPSLQGRFEEEHVDWVLQRVAQDTTSLFSS